MPKGLFVRFYVIQLDDPISRDPDFHKANPVGLLERLLSQQIPSQNRNLLQRAGIANGLFGRDSWVLPYLASDVKSDIEGVLGCSFQDFISLGLITYSLRRARLGGQSCQGTFDHLYLAEAYGQGFACCVPESWSPFLSRVATTVEGFRDMSNEGRYKSSDEIYSPWEFNVLKVKPIVDVGASVSRFVAIDPDLITDRVTRGLYYDLLDAYGKSFTDRFGDVFEEFVGDLISRVCLVPPWSTSEWERRTGQKSPTPVCDWIVSGRDLRIYVECKGLCPKLEFTSTGDHAYVRYYASRVAGGVRQGVCHSQTLGTGRFGRFSSVARELFVVVTYGHITTINSPWFRSEIDNELSSKGISDVRYIVLSIEELDGLISVAEQVGDFEEVLWRVATETPFSTVGPYASELGRCAVSRITQERGHRAFRFCRPDDWLEKEVCMHPGPWRD